MARHLNHRLAKIHLTYSVEDVARTWGVHRNTVRQWIKQGLRTIDRRRPQLIHGRDLGEFLLARRRCRRRPCAPGEIYCVRCRVPRVPAGNVADFEQVTLTQGNLIGICPACSCLIYRRVSTPRLDLARGGLDVRLREPLRHIGEKTGLSVNCDFRQGDER